MGITYNAGTDTITVTGYTSGTPCTFTDIYNADVAGGWGQVSLQGTNQFLFNCKLIVGDGSTTTWFTDTKKQITTSAASPCIEIKAAATLTLGALENLASKTGSSGCDIFATGDGWISDLIKGAITADVYLYGCSFSRYSDWNDIRIRLANSDNRVWDCLLKNRVFFTATKADIYNTFILKTGSAAGIEDPVSGTEINRVSILSCRYSIWFYNKPSVTVSNLFARNCGNLYLFLYTGQTLTLINADLDNWAITWVANINNTGFLYRQYTFNLQVTEEDGTPIQTANVVLTNNASAEVFNVNTDASGLIAEQTVSRGYYAQATGDTLQDYGPFTLTITKAGYIDYIHEGIILDEPVDWRIRLHDQLVGTAVVGDVANGETFYSNDADTQLTGTYVPLALTGTALPSDVLTGCTFYNTDATVKETGTLIPFTASAPVEIKTVKIIERSKLEKPLMMATASLLIENQELRRRK